MGGGVVPEDKVRLISADNHEFVLDSNIAFLSRTLKTFFDTSYCFKETQTRTVVLPIQSKLLIRIIEFMKHKHRNTDNLPIGEFKICDEETMELLDVASYLRI
ncbi:elongin-C [Pancytospora epiphaga]|nr:elongin-C [Pancytospora epiphaga]